MISIIIPIFNIEAYLPNCLDSVINQTYTDLEIVLIDDGSTDASGSICDEYSRKDSRIRVIHQSNCGVSAARNAGINVSTGEYVYFLDGDDLLALDSIQLLAYPLKTRAYDFTIGQVEVVGSEKSYPSLKMEDGEIIGNASIFHHYACRDFYMMAVNKLCRRDFLISNQLFFKEGIRYEDDVWSFRVSLVAESMFVVNNAVYKYVIRESSFTEKNIGRNRIVKAIPALKAINQIIEATIGVNHNDIMLFLSGLYQVLYMPAVYNMWISEYKSLREIDPRGYKEILCLCLCSHQLFRTNGHLLFPTQVGYKLYGYIMRRMLK